jgi:hypothetical protein
MFPPWVQSVPPEVTNGMSEKENILQTWSMAGRPETAYLHIFKEPPIPAGGDSHIIITRMQSVMTAHLHIFREAPVPAGGDSHIIITRM